MKLLRTKSIRSQFFRSYLFFIVILVGFVILCNFLFLEKFYVSQKLKELEEMGEKKVALFGGSVVTCFGFLFGSLIILVFIGVTHIPAAAQGITAAGLPAFANIPLVAGYTLENLPVVLYVSAGVAGVGFCAYFMAMEYQPASIVSLVYFFKPALSPVLAWALHGEEIPLNMLLGIILIVAGSFCAIVPGVIETKRGVVFCRF